MYAVRPAHARQRSVSRAAQAGALSLFCGVLLLIFSWRGDPGWTVSGDPRWSAPDARFRDLHAPPAYRGVLTFGAPGSGDPFGPSTVQELDLASNRLAVRFDGLDATRARTGEVAFVTRLKPGYAADHGVVVADTRGVTGAPVYVCRDYHYSSNPVCSTPKLSPDGRLVAFGARDSGSACRDSYGNSYGDFVLVRDRRGRPVAQFDGYTHPEWLPDGRLLMMGAQCRGAGIWVADAALRGLTRVDGNEVGTPAAAPAASPDGGRVAFVWNRQLWLLPLDRGGALTRLTDLPKTVTSAAWSPDGRALAVLTADVGLPVKSLLLLRPGDDRSSVTRDLPVYPYGPISWR